MMNQSARDLTKLIEPEKQIEIINGRIEIKPAAGAKTGGIAARIAGEIGIHIANRRLGRIYTGNTTFTIGKNQMLPGVSFVAAERIPKSGEPIGKWNFAPDLVIEIVKPSDTSAKMRTRLNRFFAAEVREAWLVKPAGIVSVYHNPLTPTQTLTRNDTLKGSLVLPDLELDLNEIFID